MTFPRAERALILAPLGRDAPLAGAMLLEAGIQADICPTLAALIASLEDEAGFAVITEEALVGANTAPLLAWFDRQPAWSDFPIILLTARGGVERNPAAARYLELLGNVTFVERPFHPTTMLSLAKAALRGRRKQYEARARLEELHELAVTLEQRVEKTVAERNEAQDGLRQAQKMEAIGQLTGGVAHDFNNMLTVIRSSADLLRRPSLTPERKIVFLDAIVDTSMRAAKLTQQLLAFSRQQALKAEIFDAVACVTAIEDMVRTLVGEGIELTVDTPDTPLAIEADVAQFETAIVNLCVNARDAMDGQGLLAIAIAPAGNQVRLTVADTGSGISQEDLTRIFDPFFTTKEIGKGTGLGLSQVYGFAKQSGGDIRVESELGKGTTFALFLPRSDGQPGEVAEDNSAPALRPGGRILVVEDNDDVRVFASELLNDLGFEVELAMGGAEALEVLDRAVHFDLVFSDVMMQGMDGVELAKEIAARKPGLPVVLTSGYSEALAGDMSHGYPFLAKPYSADELTRVIEEALA